MTWQIRQREAELGGRFPQAVPPHFRVLRAKFHCHVPPAWRIFLPSGGISREISIILIDIYTMLYYNKICCG